MGELVGVALSLGPGDVVPMARVHLDPADFGSPVEPEGDEKLVQQLACIIVAGILGVELPVPSYPLTIVASTRTGRRAASQAAPGSAPEIFLERLASSASVPNSAPSMLPIRNGRRPCARMSKANVEPTLTLMPRANGIAVRPPSSP